MFLGGEEGGGGGGDKGGFTSFGGPLGPFPRFGFVPPKNRFGPDHVPGTKRHHALRMTPRGRTGVEMHAQARIARTAQLPVLVRVAEAEVRFRMAQIGGLGEELGGVGLVAEDVLAVAGFVQEAELVGRGVVLEVGAFGGALEPFETFAVVSVQAHGSLQTGAPEPGHCAGMVLGCALAVVLDGFLDVFAGAPAEFVAECRAVAGFCVAVFGGGDEQGKGAVIVLDALVE